MHPGRAAGVEVSLTISLKPRSTTASGYALSLAAAGLLAATLGGRLQIPQLSRKYSWIGNILGWRRTQRIRQYYNRAKSFVIRVWDKLLFNFEGKDIADNRGFCENGRLGWQSAERSKGSLNRS